MKTAILDDDEVMTLEDVAAELHEMYGWKSHETDAQKGVIRFVTDEGRTFDLEKSGFAYEVVGGRTSENEDLEHEVRLADDLDLVNHIWAMDEKGNTVLICN